MIRKEAYVHQAVMNELRRVIEDSEVGRHTIAYDDTPELPA
jgi:protein mago nashi